MVDHICKNSLNINFRILETCDADKLTNLLVSSPPSYSQYFTPFEFNASSIRQTLNNADKDQFIGIELLHSSFPTPLLIAFYMLRGLDQGYQDPMYGVFVSHAYSSMGIGSLSIYHAESICKLQNYTKLLLKVYPDNVRAYKLYTRLGFLFLCKEASGQLLLYKNLKES